MKKMIFSAVALVAFSFAGMANEIEEKKVEEASTERDCFLEADMTLRVWDALYGGSGLTEQEEARFMNIFIALCEGYDVCLDATNLNPNYQQQWIEIAEECDADIVYKEFIIPFWKCVFRDWKRGLFGGRRR